MTSTFNCLFASGVEVIHNTYNDAEIEIDHARS